MCAVNVELEHEDSNILVVHLVLAATDLEELHLLQHYTHFPKNQDICVRKIQFLLYWLLDNHTFLLY